MSHRRRGDLVEDGLFRIKRPLIVDYQQVDEVRIRVEIVHHERFGDPGRTVAESGYRYYLPPLDGFMEREIGLDGSVQLAKNGAGEAIRLAFAKWDEEHDHLYAVPARLVED